MDNLVHHYDRILLHKVQFYNDRISKVYLTKSTHYGNNLETITYNRVRLSFKSTREDYNKNLKNNKNSYSLNRARQNIFQIVESNIYKHGSFKPIFSTLTYSKNQKNLIAANRDFKYFIKKLGDLLGYKIRYIAVPEFQKRGAVHYHIVFFNVPFIHFSIYEPLWSHGYTQIGYTDKKGKYIKNVASYISKYLTKDTTDKRLYGQRTFFTSRSLYKPIHSFDLSYIENLQKSYIFKRVGFLTTSEFTKEKFRLLINN